MQCKSCKYISTSKPLQNALVQIPNISCCQLTNLVVNPDANNTCEFYNKSFTDHKICYNCKFYVGGGDWGLFCSHPEKYYCLGKFNDPACQYFTT